MLHFFGFSTRQKVKINLFSHLKEDSKMPTLDQNKIKIYDAGNTVADRYNRGHLGRRLTLDDLPEPVQQFVKDNFI